MCGVCKGEVERILKKKMGFKARIDEIQKNFVRKYRNK